VLYVWFDALTNYLTGAQYPSGERAVFWPAALQIVGKDITWFHCVIWPAMLLSAGLPLPRTVYAHGFVMDEVGQKMSKSVGNVVDPNTVLDFCSPDTFRYALALFSLVLFLLPQPVC
jgi:methionyl-tRNA synthetase